MINIESLNLDFNIKNLECALNPKNPVQNKNPQIIQTSFSVTIILESKAKIVCIIRYKHQKKLTETSTKLRTLNTFRYLSII